MSNSESKNFFDINQLRFMPLSALEDWVKSVLFAAKPGVGGGRFDSPSEFLGQAYRKLDPGVRECFRDVLAKYLASMAQDQESEWHSEAGDELLLLVGKVFQEPEFKSKIIDLLLYISEYRQRLRSLSPNLHWRALQALVALRHRALPDFWRIQYRLGNEYALVVVGGLSLIHPGALTDWMKSVPASDALFSALMGRLPWLLDTYGSDATSLLVRDVLRIWSPSEREKLEAFARQLSLRIASSREEGFFSDWSEGELRDVIDLLGLPVESATPRASLIRVISATLEAAAATRKEDIPEKLLLTIGFHKYLRNTPGRLSEPICTRLANFVAAILESEELGRELRDLLEEIHYLAKNSGINLEVVLRSYE